VSGYGLSPLAALDLGRIWDYSAEHWGADQADLYVRQIGMACADLASGRKQGRSIDLLRAGYLRYPTGSHVLFYRWGTGRRMEVVRILHQRMDVGLHL
jgi:toxin ParE1/3/4